MSQSNYTRRTCAVTRSVTVSQPAVPLTVVEVCRGDGGTTEIARHACVGIETRLVREYSIVVHRNQPEPFGGHRPKLLSGRALRDEGWEYCGESIEHYPLFLDREFGVIPIDSDLVNGGNVYYFTTYANDPDYDAKLNDAKGILEARAARKVGAA